MLHPRISSSYLFSLPLLPSLSFPSSVLLPLSHPNKPGRPAFSWISASSIVPGMVVVGGSLLLLTHFLFNPSPPSQGRGHLPRAGEWGASGVPLISHPPSVVLYPGAPSLSMVQPQVPAMLCHLSPPHTCLCPGPGHVPPPGTPCFSMRISDLRPTRCPPIAFGPSAATHRGPAGCERTPRPTGPGRLVQEDRAGLSPSPRPKGCCPYPGAGQRNHMPHQLLWPCDKGQHLAHGRGQGSSELRFQSICFKDPSLYGT